MGKPESEADRRLLLCIFYRSPWEALMGFFLGVRRDGTLRWEISGDEGGWRRALDAASHFCEQRDAAWRRRHVARGTTPWPAWKRRVP